jgi:hypothetical protein
MPLSFQQLEGRKRSPVKWTKAISSFQHGLLSREPILPEPSLLGFYQSLIPPKVKETLNAKYSRFSHGAEIYSITVP